MLKRSILCGGILLALALSLALPVTAQTNHTVRVVNNSFIPRTLSIQAGDSVTWTNEGVNHNVRAADGSFRCANGCDGDGGNGAPASNSWSFTLTFNQAGEVPYFCEVHGSTNGSQVFGMAGTVVVEGSSEPDEPGTVQFDTNNVNVNEGDGRVTLRVTRGGGSDGAISVDYATENRSATAGSDFAGRSGTLEWANGDGSARTFNVPLIDDNAEEGEEAFRVRLSNPTGGAAIGSRNPVRVVIADNDGGGGGGNDNGGDDTPPGEPGELGLAMETFEVDENAGTATVVVERSGGASGPAEVTVTVTGGTAAEGEDLMETTETVSWSDGDDDPKEVAVALIDDEADEGVETAGVELSGASGASLGDATEGRIAILDDDGGDACSEDDGQTLCLNEGDRFKVQVSFRTQQGDTGRGQIIPLNRDSGLFTFFDPNNAEILIKVLNSCPLAINKYWVFFAGTTNQQFTLTVTDTEADVVTYYEDPLGEVAETVLDIRAFDTCP